MKRLPLSLGILALITTLPFLGTTPVLANLQEAGEALVQAIRRPEVKLNLTADKQLLELDQSGKQKITWQSLEGNAVVQPGDVLRYSVNSQNAGDAAAKNLVVTQPIPQKTMYEIGSATSNNGAKTTYSIDNGNSFVDKPMVKVTLPDGTVEEQPAPADTYTHVRWQFGSGLDPAAGVKASYQVKVR
ncbi:MULTISPECIES: DUF11 domain-containing protein [unclassified Coleofasciculus]|uniref:DUF11 domain-containing protein n=1 Tax=unclassified Coleofasciculus TaxID=2692782 RepID=UPI0018830F5A|nr:MULTISPECIES: DUF11 domain-containing protein [unclassified Coleofasciculus]MBE9126551.1 DUF11 domain-containing protein [Coleofasciculus sp. LEGE 07081]MBE9149985.1 DUF11 domain-containing protein [Coleofasciculus sp. LEGE 07092]